MTTESRNTGVAMELEWARAWIEQYGYFALFVSTLIEGEAVLLAAAAASAAGLMRPEAVVFVAACGAFAGHLIFFAIGRRWGMRLVAAFPALARQYPRVNRVLDEHADWSVFLFQYLYGTRLASAVLFGCSTIRLARFVFLQVLNCLSWALLVFTAGLSVGWLLARAHAMLGTGGTIAAAALGVLALGWAMHRFGGRVARSIMHAPAAPGPEQLDAETGRRAFERWLDERGGDAREGWRVLRAVRTGRIDGACAARLVARLRAEDRAWRVAENAWVLALKGSPPEGVEAVRRRLAGDGWELSVFDAGVGLTSSTNEAGAGCEKPVAAPAGLTASS